LLSVSLAFFVRRFHYGYHSSRSVSRTYVMALTHVRAGPSGLASARES
jgi:hypothetical protein